jgi:hypothetical protein
MEKLKIVASEIRDILEKRRNEISLNFIEEDHIYYMKDINGEIKNNFISVSSIIKLFHEHFDSEKKALEMSNGDVSKQQELLLKWKLAADYSTNQGSRVHYELEKELINRNGNYKTVREPIFTINDEQRINTDNMINAGKNFLNLMEQRNCVLLDTEIVLGDPELGYVGQPDKVWLLEHNNEITLCISDYKTNQPKNFEVQHYTKNMFKPFDNYPDTALGHYYLQIPLYGKLLIKMLQGTKYENIKLLGGIIVLLKKDGNFVEYRVPKNIINKILELNIKSYF